MRPGDPIPVELLDVDDDLGERLPLLEAWLESTAEPLPLAGCFLFFVQHQLAN